MILKLSKFEFKKLFTGKNMIIAILIMLIFNVVNIYRNYYEYNQENIMQNARYDLYSEIKGDISLETYTYITQNKRLAQQKIYEGNYDTTYQPDEFYSGYAYGDANLWTEVLEEYERIIYYTDEMNELVDLAKANLSLTNISEFYINQNQQIANLYSNRLITEYRNSDGIESFSSYKFSLMLTLLLLIFSISNTFSSDHENNTICYLKTSINGKYKSCIAKLNAVSLYTLILTSIFFATDLIAFIILLRIDGFTQPIYSVSGFYDSPLNISIISFLALNFLYRFLGFLTFALIVAFISSIFKKITATFLASIAMLVSFMATKTFITLDIGILVNSFNPISTIQFASMFENYSVILIFNYPVSIGVISFLCTATLGTIFAISTLIIGGRRYD